MFIVKRKLSGKGFLLPLKKRLPLYRAIRWRCFHSAFYSLILLSTSQRTWNYSRSTNRQSMDQIIKLEARNDNLPAWQFARHTFNYYKLLTVLISLTFVGVVMIVKYDNAAKLSPRKIPDFLNFVFFFAFPVQKKENWPYLAWDRITTSSRELTRAVQSSLSCFCWKIHFITT